MEPHYARLTAYVKTLLAGAAASVDLPPGAAPAAQRVSSVAGMPDAVALGRLETELARFIGPVARHLVNRAVLRASGVEDLLTHLGREIESEAERREFLAAARQSLRGRP
jgi:hypothetical protein